MNKKNTEETASSHQSMPCCPDTENEIEDKTPLNKTPMFMFECAGNSLASVKPFHYTVPDFTPVIISYTSDVLLTLAETIEKTKHLAKPPPDYDIAGFYALPAQHISSTVLRI